MDAARFVFRNIWMVDDDCDDVLVFENVIKELLPGVQFQSLDSGDALLARASASVPDLLFLDINMPRVNGHETLRRLRDELGPSLPVVMYSGSDFDRDINLSYGFGATLFLVKPATEQALRLQLRALLQLNWDDPQAISQAHFTGKGFVPFSAE